MFNRANPSLRPEHHALAVGGNLAGLLVRVSWSTTS